MSPKKKGSRILYPATKTRINMSKRTKIRSTGTCDEYKEVAKWCTLLTFQKRGTLERSPENMSPTSEPRLNYGFLWLFLFLHPSSRQSLQAKITYIVKSWHCFQVCDNLNFHKKKGSFTLRELQPEQSLENFKKQWSWDCERGMAVQLVCGSQNVHHSIHPGGQRPPLLGHNWICTADRVGYPLM